MIVVTFNFCRASVGHLVMTGGVLVVDKLLTLKGDLECSGGDCPSKSKAVLFDFEKNRVCSIDDGGGDDDDGDGSICAASVRFSCDLLQTHK